MAGSLNGDDKDSSSAMLLDLKALDCPICYEPLITPIFQCDNGHILCYTCCTKVRNKCPSCTLPIGDIRNRAMERIIKEVIVPCQNVKLGCTKRFSYGRELSTHHEKECVFSLCSCPSPGCNYKGSYIDLYVHFDLNHLGDDIGERRQGYFKFGKFTNINFQYTEYNTCLLRQFEDGLLFVVQCFITQYGLCLTASCIAPCAKEVGEFSCEISTTEGCSMTIRFPKIKKIRKVSSKTPKEDFMLVPPYMLRGRQVLKLKVCFNKVEER